MKLAIFESVRNVTKADNICKEMKIDVTIVAIPKEISSDCGIGIKLDDDIVKNFDACMAEKGISYILYNY